MDLDEDAALALVARGLLGRYVKATDVATKLNESRPKGADLITEEQVTKALDALVERLQARTLRRQRVGIHPVRLADEVGPLRAQAALNATRRARLAAVGIPVHVHTGATTHGRTIYVGKDSFVRSSALV
jgi:hypothetical protein